MTPRARKRQRIDRALAAHAPAPAVILAPSGQDRTVLVTARRYQRERRPGG